MFAAAAGGLVLIAVAMPAGAVLRRRAVGGDRFRRRCHISTGPAGRAGMPSQSAALVTATALPTEIATSVRVTAVLTASAPQAPFSNSFARS